MNDFEKAIEDAEARGLMVKQFSDGSYMLTGPIGPWVFCRRKDVSDEVNAKVLRDGMDYVLGRAEGR